MPKKNELTHDELIAKIEAEEAIAYGINDEALAKERADAISYYLGEPFGNEVEGRSQVVSYDVQDTIESALPQLLKVFVAGDDVVNFVPFGQEDEEAAQQESDYINHVVMQKNRGFEVFYTWFKDALMSKNGYVRVWFEKEYEAESETYNGLTDAQLAMMLQDERIEVVRHTEYPDHQAQQMLDAHIQQMIQSGQDPALMQHPPIPSLHDVKITITEERGCIKVRNVAPESIMVSVDTVGLSLQESRFVQHRERTTAEELRERGFKVPDDIGFSDSDYALQESNARDLYSEQFGDAVDVSDTIMVRDTYIRMDGELRRVVLAGNTVILDEEAEIVPFVCICPMPMPHRHIGLSYADLTMDIQKIKSALIRGQLDNMYLSNQGRWAISSRVNMEDMLTSRPGGVVRVDGSPGTEIVPLSHVPFPATSFTMVEYLDSMKEKRTGVTAYNQGLDSDSLNKTASGVSMIMNASAMRLELVARVFAETGVKDLFCMVHRLVRQNYTKPDVVRLRNKWVEVDPRAWKNRKDMTISVGLGTGNKDSQLVHLQSIIQAQQMGLQVGISTPKNIYNAMVKLTENAGFKMAEEFWTDPDMVSPKEPQQDPAIAVEMAKLQAKREEQAAELQADQQKFKATTIIEQQKAEQQARQEMLRSQNDIQIERDKLRMQAELERYKADLKAQTELAIAEMQLEFQARNSMMEAMKGNNEAGRTATA